MWFFKNKSIKEEIRSLLEEIDNCINTINSSNSLSSVILNYDVLMDSLQKLQDQPKKDFFLTGIHPEKIFKEKILPMQDNYTTIMLEAIDRAYNAQCYKAAQKFTVKEKAECMEAFFSSAKKMKGFNKVLKDRIFQLQNNDTYINLLHQQNTKTSIKPSKPKITNQRNMIIPSSINTLNISSEIKDLLWIADGNRIAVFSDPEEPSALYLSLPVSEPSSDTIIESPPYFPVYKDLSPEQKWLYWQFLSNPFSTKNNIGYVFLFYYGLERHMLSKNLEKAFNITLKLREIYQNSSFQFYTAQTLTLICISKQRTDLALKFLESYSKNKISSISMKYLLILKYTFQLPLTASEIIKDYQYFGFNNNRYIKNQSELFTQVFLELLNRDFQSDAIDLNLYFPIDIHTLPVEEEEMFANISLNNYKIPVPVFQNPELEEKILDLLEEAHEIVKIKLRELRKQGKVTSTSQPASKPKLSPIESENIPQKLVFDFSDMKDWKTWSNNRILGTYYNLSNIIENSKEVTAKIEACEKSYIILKSVMKLFLSDPDDPPPVILCREYGPYIYRLLGNWEDAERAIHLCMDANAYEELEYGKEELEYLTAYRKVAETAINFIQQNPRFLQKNIYIALLPQIGEEQIPILKDFMRETYVFHKQPCKGTNELSFIKRK